MSDDIADDIDTARLMGTRYYRGAPCKRGHEGVRFTTTNACVDCSREDGLLRRADPAYQAAERERRAAWAAANPDKVKASKKRDREKNVERERAARKLYKETDPNGAIARRKAEKAAAAAIERAKREWWQLAKRTARAVVARAQKASKAARSAEAPFLKKALRRSRERNAKGQHTQEQLNAILAMQGGTCAYCDETDGLHLDHIISLADGGTNWPWNLQYLCKPHNSAKGDWCDASFRARIGVPVETPLSVAIWMTAFGLPVPPPAEVQEKRTRRRRNKH